MSLSDISIRRPVFTVMVTLALMVLGGISVMFIGVDLFPDISFPVVTVSTVYPGAGPEEVEQLVTKKIEEAVSSSNGIDEVRSYSRDSVSMIVIQFKLETDIKSASTDVRDKVSAIRNALPEDIKDPTIQRLDLTALPVLTYAVSSKRNSAETRRLVEDVVKPRLEAIDGVAAVDVIGGEEREVHIFVDSKKIESLGLSLSGLAQQVGAEAFDLPGGRINAGAVELNVKTLGRFRSLEEVGNLVIASLANGSQVHLRDVASIENGVKDVRTKTRLDGNEAVSFQIQKQGGSNTVAISNAVYKVINDLKTTLPGDVKIVKAIDASVFIRRNIDDVEEAIIFGGLMAILVIFVFMLDWRSTLISALALPTSVVTTFLAMWYLGFTFNMMSLLGLSLAIGLLIDDAVVVRENIYRHMEMGKDPITAASEGTKQIALAVTATTLTIVAVFVPVAFMGGIIGRMFRQFGLTVTAAVLVSLFISFTLDPMMSARVMKPVEPGHQEKMRRHPIYGRILAAYEALDRAYRNILAYSLSHRNTVMAGAGVLFFASLFLVQFMGKEFVSPGDRGEFRVNLEMPAGTSLSEMERVTTQTEALIRQNSEVRTLFTTIGPSQEANKASLRVYTTKSNERTLTQVQIEQDIRQRLAGLPGLKSQIAELGIVEGPAAELPIVLYVRGNDYAKLQQVADQALTAMRSVTGVTDADSSFRAGKPETNVLIKREQAADLGVSAGVVAQTIRLGLEGDVVAKFRDGDRDYDVRMQLQPDERRSIANVEQLVVPSTLRRLDGRAAAGGRLVRLTDVAQVVNGSGPGTIERMNRQRQIILSANATGRSLGDVVADINVKLAKVEKPEGFSFVFGGQTKNMQETFTNMLIAIAVAILFIYFVLASQFESFVHPFTIMFALPLAIVGALLGLFLFDLPLGMPSMIGMVLLMGLVTKNAILLIDYTNELRHQGKSVTEALLEAGPTRLRPILMTSAAMVLGMLPTAMARGEGSEFRAPMATSVIGGVIVSTFLTLVVVPIVYTWMDRFTLEGRRARKAAKVGVSATVAAETTAPPAKTPAEAVAASWPPVA